MKSKLCLLLFLFTLVSSAQGEANNWYFGQNAGLQFLSDGSVLPLSDGLLNTEEGCSAISDANGNLLFYTDGRTVWDRNHTIMPNGDYFAGTGLFGDPSSTQSGIIVPRPNHSNQYYIFTVDEPHHENAQVYPNSFSGNYIEPGSGNVPNSDDGKNNGLNYSMVDMSVFGNNGSIGDIINRNIHLITYDTNSNGEQIKYKCSEKITAVKNETDNSYWVITHFVNTFYAFKVTQNGVASVPVTSVIGSNQQLTGYRRNAIGYLKVSPNGQKIAIAHQQNGIQIGQSSFGSGSIELFDFNVNTGVVSNFLPILPNVQGYGVEFSPNSERLYATYRIGTSPTMELAQFDLTQSDPENTKQIIYDGVNYLFALQLAPNNKIYCATGYQNSLGVISNPDNLGIACNYDQEGQVLAPGKTVQLGLPPFVSSFFNAFIEFNNNCYGDTTSFSINSNQTVVSVLWNFGDGTTSTLLQPNHIYANPGIYDVSITIQTPFGSGSNSRQITIFPRPQMTSTFVSLKQCDDNNDGFSAFNLTEVNELVVPSTAGLSFSYHLNLADAQNDVNPIISETAYVNPNVNTSVVYVRVENANGCYRIATLNLVVSTTLIPASFQRVFSVCDDENSGSNTDGIASFNFNSVTADVQALFPVGQQLVIRYYKDLNDALAEQNPISNTSNFINTNSPLSQNIYIRVDSLLDNACLGLGHHITLQVEPIPIIQSLAFKECDDNQDGVFGFNTSGLMSTILNGISNASLSFWDANNMPLPSPLPNPFYTTTQTIKVRATNTTTNACFYESTLSFTVDVLPVIYSIPSTLTTVCDDEINPIEQDGLFAFDTSQFQNILLGGQTGMIVKYIDNSGNELPSSLPNPYISGTQNIQVEVINSSNSSCKSTALISFIVHEVPQIELLGNELICSNNTSFTKILTAGLVDEQLISDYLYQWSKEDVEIIGANGYELVVNSEGIYSVEVTSIDGCSRTRTYTVTASNIATIEEIEVVDLSSNNTIRVFVSGAGDYMYSLDNEYYQAENIFHGVEPGLYTVYVKDLNGCGTVNQTVSVLGIPKFFTPNGDGFNDVWNLKGVDATKYANSSIFIYDRFGKFLKQISPHGNGWDGTFNGSLMPTSDYWFVINLDDGRIIKGHFALKR